MVRDPQTLGERLTLVRNQHGITRWHTAQVLGVLTQEVAEAEQNSQASLLYLATFCDLFRVRWPWLVDGLGAREQYPAMRSRSDGRS